MLRLTIPTRNEAPYITDTIRRLSKSLADLTIPWQIIIADNGSTDGTADAVNQCQMPNAKCQIQEASGINNINIPEGYNHSSFVIRNLASEGTKNPEELIRTSYDVHRTKELVEPVDGTKYEVRSTNLVYLACPIVGKGAAIRYAANQITNAKCQMPNNGGLRHNHINEKYPEGIQSFVIRHSSFDIDSIFGFIDADLSADPDAIPGMVARILEGKADIVIASRLLVTKTTNRSWLRTLSSKLFNFLADFFLNLKVADAQCGLKIMNMRGLEVLKSCKEDGWFLDIEFLARARQDKLRIVEIPVPWIEFRYPERKSQIRHFRDGLEAFKAIWRIRKRI